MATSHFTVISTPRSKAYSCLAILLEEVDLIIAALPKKVRGRPKTDERNNINKKRDALCKAALVLLSAALEASPGFRKDVTPLIHPSGGLRT